MADDEQLSGSNVEKDPDQWVTGEEPMTGAQKSYLKTCPTRPASRSTRA